MVKLNRILAPTDFSEYSTSAMHYACELADRFGAQLHVLTVVNVSTPLYADPEFMPIEEFVLREEQAARNQLQQQPDAPWSEKLNVVRELKTGTPFLEIIRYAKEKTIDLIVLGTHGRTGLAHALMGSVAERVVRKSPCPVLTVRDPEHKFVMP